MCWAGELLKSRVVGLKVSHRDASVIGGSTRGGRGEELAGGDSAWHEGEARGENKNIRVEKNDGEKGVRRGR
ncbi:hypothetical protein RRG08_010637 [Elysia crispata]|uniref:Uncharacterized protein n=1 Tax=Elysia crispata TaxID=231223 RepID=A0AAE0XQE5_9GAST|nr:hypothetical protein RRG08_010637 [Elysia crispata]